MRKYLNMMSTALAMAGLLLLPASCVPESPATEKEIENDFHAWAETPPMGWNSWDCFGPSVTEAEVKANADYMAEHLKEYGWEYVVVDIRWYVDNQTAGHYNPYDESEFIIDEYGRYMPSPTRFPSSVDGKGFKPLADYVHSLGLKFGIHIMRGVPKEAVYNELPVKGTEVTAADIYSTAKECTWLKDNYTVLAEKEGGQAYYNSILDLYADWGVDFIKVDDLSRPYHTEEIEMIRKAIDQTGRPIVLSMSPGATPLEEHAHARNHANMWRTVDDFWDNWSQLNFQFDKCADWAPYISAGAWPDADMLPLGHLAIRGERGDDRYTNFTKDEQYTLMTLWTIFKSPLMFGGHLPDNDAFTNSLLTNKEVLDMHSRSVNNRQWYKRENLIAWTADDPDSEDKYVAVFNNESLDFIRMDDILYSSGTISKLTDNYSVSIDLEIPAGSDELYLVVNDGDDGFSCDHADWINPTLYLSNGDSVSLTSLEWESATAGWQKTQKNRSITGNTLTVNGVEYEHGIGTHARSIIAYKIPENTIRFRVLAGLDSVGLAQGCGSTIEFMVATEDPRITEKTLEDRMAAIDLAALGFDGECTIRDLWQQKDLGTFSGADFTVAVPQHGARLFKISGVHKAGSKAD
ncbi:NPCBM/NEW2 domain-containing protein [Roseivirga sp. BDSF3-8]|uniref:NPCBM/NEW2 domain-containing protein n=1 Tax=Roseivirga sp. BDSF3-8 TaxID=3241598 RepID=UPI003531D9F4